jgi:hypothetical protein
MLLILRRVVGLADVPVTIVPRTYPGIANGAAADRIFALLPPDQEWRFRRL